MTVGMGAAARRPPIAVKTWRWPVEIIVFAVAVGARMAVVLRSGGFLGNYGYDTSVYYAAADALIHGRMPYRDFVLLHPPGLMLAETPFALLGRLTTDHIGYASANLGFSIIGAVNAVLVVRVANKLGIGQIPAAVGGLFYAVWLTSVSAEFSARLEPLGNLFLVTGLLAIFSARRNRRWLLFAVAGASLGLALSVKIWFVVPFAVVLGWLVIVERRPRMVATFLAGALAACVVVDGPFLLLAARQMWSMVISAQLGRHRMALPLLDRLTELSSSPDATRHLGSAAKPALVVAAGLVLAAVLTSAWRTSAARVMAVLTLAQLAVLIASPSYFGFYGDYAAVALSLCVAAAAATHGWARVSGWLPTVAVGAVTLIVCVRGTFGATSSWHGADRMIDSVAQVPCVMSDAPAGLIELNALDRSFANGCRNWVDVTGRTYLSADRTNLPRPANMAWQRDLRSYLRSGGAVFLVRIAGTGINADTLRIIKSGGVLASADGFRVYDTAPPANQGRGRALKPVRAQGDLHARESSGAVDGPGHRLRTRHRY